MVEIGNLKGEILRNVFVSEPFALKGYKESIRNIYLHGRNHLITLKGLEYSGMVLT